MAIMNPEIYNATVFLNDNNIVLAVQLNKGSMLRGLNFTGGRGTITFDTKSMTLTSKPLFSKLKTVTIQYIDIDSYYRAGGAISINHHNSETPKFVTLLDGKIFLHRYKETNNLKLIEQSMLNHGIKVITWPVSSPPSKKTQKWLFAYVIFAAIVGLIIAILASREH